MLPKCCHQEILFIPANRRESSRVAGGGGGGAMGLGDMVRKELAGKHFLNFEPHGEKLRKRIISKKGHVNIGKVKVSKRWVSRTLWTVGITILLFCWDRCHFQEAEVFVRHFQHNARHEVEIRALGLLLLFHRILAPFCRSLVSYIPIRFDYNRLFKLSEQ